ncbi:sulfotransferase [Candidatus Nitronereus thalassa]|uniref:Sulfotransferase n=1 Tax=Candidatus Nitronereus thalassa TaxID=3020898 RepID=A0ABU3K602_9BACT|nr:sulfotransferase [Candidatus Nitronereus thalassa]MDT7041847.1 sulfotransferase [Candidatus Nitronereus thalassa]
MSRDTKPFFIVSSGRSGTQLMEKVFGLYPQVEMHHEYLCTHVQPLAVRYYMGLISLDEVCQELSTYHGAAINYSTRGFWGDSSNKLSWLIEALDRLFPNAKFIYIVRDGRKVTSSFFHKLGHECYDDRSTNILQNHIDHPDQLSAPPPEKKYWWNLPPAGSAMAHEFRGFNQFQRICFHWGEVNRWIQRTLAPLGESRKRIYKLEELVSNPDAVEDMLSFLGLPIDQEIFSLIKHPHNVGTPIDRLLTDEQRLDLMTIAGDVMRQFGYDRTEEYRMEYDSIPEPEPSWATSP